MQRPALDDPAALPEPQEAAVPTRAAGPALPVWQSDGDYTASMLRDVTQALRRWPLWGLLGWQDVMLRYRRSVLGPLWLTLSLGVMTVTLAVIYGDIFRAEKSTYLLYLATGFLVWNLISALASEGCQTFIEADWLIRQTDLPLAMFPLRTVWRIVIVFLHNTLVYVVVVLFSPVQPGWALLGALPGLAAILLNGLWVTTLLGMLSARFRDLPQIVGSVMQVVFFATPIIWPAEAVSNARLLVEGNPFYHFVQVLRQPLVGQVAPLSSWLVVCAVTVAGLLATVLFYRRFHGRIAYWV